MTDVCKRGHDLTDPANVYTAPGTGYRTCRACKRLTTKAWYEEHSAPGPVAPQPTRLDRAKELPLGSEERKLAFQAGLIRSLAQKAARHKAEREQREGAKPVPPKLERVGPEGAASLLGTTFGKKGDDQLRVAVLAGGAATPSP